MTALSVFPNHQWTILVLLVCFAGLRAETETDPSTAELLARIEALEKRGLQADTEQSKTELLARVEELEKQGVEQRHRIDRQEEHIADQDHRIATLQARVQDQEKTIVTLLNHIKVSDDHVHDENGDDAEERSQVAQTPQGKQNSADQRRRHVLDHGPVAFLVRMDNALGSLGKYQNIRYDSVRTNIGGGYHDNQGLFIAPVAGIYVFSTTVTSDLKPNNYIETELTKNGEYIAATYAFNSYNRDQGSITAVVQLDANDEVWVRVRWPAIDAVVCGYALSTFTGFLLTPTHA